MTKTLLSIHVSNKQWRGDTFSNSKYRFEETYWFCVEVLIGTAVQTAFHEEDCQGIFME